MRPVIYELLDGADIPRSMGSREATRLQMREGEDRGGGEMIPMVSFSTIACIALIGFSAGFFSCAALLIFLENKK